MSNDLDPDQDRQSVGPDLGPKLFASYQQTIKEATSKELEMCLWDRDAPAIAKFP